MTRHKFRVGQIVRYCQQRLVGGTVEGDFSIQRLLPPTGADMQYRIRSTDEAVERVARESELSDGAAVQALAQELYAAQDGSGVPWTRRTIDVQRAWLTTARAAHRA